MLCLEKLDNTDQIWWVNYSVVISLFLNIIYLFIYLFQQLDPDGHIERTTVIRVVTTDDDEYKVRW